MKGRKQKKQVTGFWEGGAGGGDLGGHRAASDLFRLTILLFYPLKMRKQRIEHF